MKNDELKKLSKEEIKKRINVFQLMNNVMVGFIAVVLVSIVVLMIQGKSFSPFVGSPLLLAIIVYANLRTIKGLKQELDNR